MEQKLFKEVTELKGQIQLKDAEIKDLINTVQSLAVKEESWKILLVQKQKEVYRLEDVIQQQKKDILDLEESKQALSLQLSEATNQLSSRGEELTKYMSLEDKFNELHAKGRSWQGELQQLEERVKQSSLEELGKKTVRKEKKGFFRWLQKKFFGHSLN